MVALRAVRGLSDPTAKFGANVSFSYIIKREKIYMLSVKDSGRKTAVFSAHPPVHVYQLHVHCKTSKNYKLSVKDSGHKTAVFCAPVSSRISVTYTLKNE